MNSPPDERQRNCIAVTTEDSAGSIRNLLAKRPIRILVFPLILFVITIILSSLSISGTSIGVLEGNPTQDFHLPHVIAGAPRTVRSDEWNVITPIIVEQSRGGFSSQLQIGLGAHNLNVIGDVPTTNWSTLFRPWDLPSLVLGSTQGFASRWWLLSLLLIFGSYALILELTDRIDLSIYFSLGIWLSPFFQWWYASGTLATVGMGFLALFFVLRALRSTRYALLGYSLGAAWASVGFVFVLYPPFQIPVALIIGSVAVGEIGHLVQSRQFAWKRTLTAGAGIGAAVVALVAAWFVGNSVTISEITGTIYPGHRTLTGGGAILGNVLSAPFGLELALHGANALVATNQSEISSFLILGPFALIQFFFIRRSQLDLRSKWIFGMLSIAFLVFAAWMFVGLPTVIARLLFLDQVGPGRAIIGLGLSGFLMLAVLTGSVLRSHRHEAGHKNRSWYSVDDLSTVIGGAICGVLALAMYLWAGSKLQAENPALGLSMLQVVLLSGFAGATIGFLAGCRIKIGGVLLILLSLSAGIVVNPFYQGLEPLSQSKIIQSFSALASKQQDPGKKKWVALEGTPVPDLLTASNLPTVNAVQLFPDQQFWKGFVPGKSAATIWNRYANLVFSAGAAGSHNMVSLLQTDQIRVSFDPCGYGANELQVGFYVSPVPMTGACLTLQEQQTYLKTPVYVYSRN